MTDIEVGDIFFAFTDAINPPKVKIHVCVADKCFFLVNTKRNIFGDNFVIKKSDCNLLEHDSYLFYGQAFYRNPNDFKIIKKDTLSPEIIERVISHIQVSLLLTQTIQQEIQ